MIALNDRPRVTPACKPWCAEHETGPTDLLSHRSEPIEFTRDHFGHHIRLGLITVESSDAIDGPRIYVEKDGEDDPLTLTEAHTLVDALTELIAATEANA